MTRAKDDPQFSTADFIRELNRVAVLVEADDSYLPLFERLEHELQLAEAAELSDPVERVRRRLAARKAP